MKTLLFTEADKYTPLADQLCNEIVALVQKMHKKHPAVSPRDLTSVAVAAINIAEADTMLDRLYLKGK